MSILIDAEYITALFTLINQLYELIKNIKDAKRNHQLESAMSNMQTGIHDEGFEILCEMSSSVSETQSSKSRKTSTNEEAETTDATTQTEAIAETQPNRTSQRGVGYRKWSNRYGK